MVFMNLSCIPDRSSWKDSCSCSAAMSTSSGSVSGEEAVFVTGYGFIGDIFEAKAVFESSVMADKIILFIK